MADAFAAIVRTGTSLPAADLSDVEAVVQDVKRQSGDPAPLCRGGVGAPEPRSARTRAAALSSVAHGSVALRSRPATHSGRSGSPAFPSVITRSISAGIPTFGDAAAGRYAYDEHRGTGTGYRRNTRTGLSLLRRSLCAFAQSTDTVVTYAGVQRVRCIVGAARGGALMTEGLMPYFGGVSITMLARDYVERELSHIQRMVALLDSETDLDNVSMSGAGRVRHPRYWRGRIEELMSTPDVPRHVRKLSEAVLAKIDEMEVRFATMK